uniref:Small integral membrane protein 4 n=1 Tax=Amblyomma maculatum TaxID=34609 RepID=G3MN14_AMBMU
MLELMNRQKRAEASFGTREGSSGGSGGFCAVAWVARVGKRVRADFCHDFWMKKKLSAWIARAVQDWPGKNTFGPYRFLPAFFLLGAALEFAMINWTPGGNTNFYKTFKRRQAKSMVDLKQSS